MADKKYYLYSITCLVNNKVYVGVCRWWKQRVCKHLYDFRNGNHANKILQEDFKKYGEQAFSFEILNEFETKEAAAELEKHYTDVVYKLNQDVCYNILSGGLNVTEQMRNRYREMVAANPSIEIEAHRKCGLAQRGKTISEGTKQKIREKRLGSKASNDVKRNFSEMRKGAGNSKAKKVIDTATGKMYGCLKDATSELGFNYDMIRGRINGYNKQKTTLRWL